MIHTITPKWPAPKNVHAFTTTRQGGVSQGNYAEFNTALHVGDDPENVIKNRNILYDSLNLPEDPRWLDQIHSNLAIEASTIQANSQADASFTTHPNIVCAIQTADCLPILLCNQQGTEIAAIHAGWRGLASNIVANTLKSLKSPPSELMAWLGPAISVDVYEIGSEVKQEFMKQNSSFESAFREKNGKLFADLYEIALTQLSQLGIKLIYTEKFCTYTDKMRFYSYRRDGMNSGRMASLIWLTTEN